MLHAGDIIDSACVLNTRGRYSHEALQAVMTHLRPKGFLDAADQAGLVCLVGNHELANFSRTELRSGVHPRAQFVCANGSFYYRFSPAKVEAARWRFIVLDCFEVAVQSEGIGLGFLRYGGVE